MLVYTSMVRRVIEDMVQRVPALRHIDPRRVAVVAAPRVSLGRNGNLAQCQALRQPETLDYAYWYHPRSRRVVRVTPWVRHRNTTVRLDGVEMLYVIVLRLPRLLRHDPLETVVHELGHIGPNCDGRMNPLRHGRRFEAIVRECVRLWRRDGAPDLVAMMDMDYGTIMRDYGSLVAHSFARKFVSPRLCPVDDPPPLEAHPDFRRRRLEYDPAELEIVPAQWTPADVPDILTEKDLVYRVYTPRGARRVSAAVVQASRISPRHETNIAIPTANPGGA
ncbi:hypothetical protein JW916_16560 [Candidatus Sumerlaeota bacterium]|nr:hypothetical protein [Candidatus Sumerlaeota bacterium]